MSVAIPKLNKYWQINSIRSDDGLTLRYGLYCRSEVINRAVIFSNGRSEWIEKYDFLPELLQLPQDCAFLTWDHRGQGASGGQRAFVNDYSDYARDAAAIIKDALPEGTKYMGMAHSMGGLVMTFATLKGFLRPERLLLSAPLFLLPETLLKRNVTKFITSVMNRKPLRNWHTGVGSFEKSRFARNVLTHSLEGFELVHNAPYKVPSPTFGWVHASLAASDYIFEDEALRNLSCPVAIVGGSGEKVVDPRGFSLWAQKASKLSKQEIYFEMIPDAKHEIFNEIPKYRDRIIRLGKNWLQKFVEESR